MSIANGIIDVYTDNYKKTKLKKFLWENCIDKYEKLYYNMLSKKKK